MFTEKQLDLEILKLARTAYGSEDDQGRTCDEKLTLETLEALELVRRRCERLERQLVVAARWNGSSWARIGQAVGVTRQAAQQKYATEEGDHGHPGLRRLGPTTRREEMLELTAAAVDGWLPSHSFHGYHLLRQTKCGTWELKRRFIFSPPPPEVDGWSISSIRFPDCFLVRQLQDG